MYYNNYKVHNYHDYNLFISYYYYFSFINCSLDCALHVGHHTLFTTSPPVCHNCVTKLGIFSFLYIREFLEMGRLQILILRSI
jgi:hypothetical protein